MSYLSEAARTLGALVRQPGFALLASGTFSLGLGALLAAFSLIDALALRSPPWPNHDRVVIFGGRTEDDAMRAVSPYLYEAVGASDPDTPRGLAYAPTTVNAVDAGHRELLRSQRVDAEFLGVLGVVAHVGSNLSATHGIAEAMLSYAMWKRWYDGDVRVEGRTIWIDGEAVRIAGVLPEDYRFFSDVDLLLLPRVPPEGSATAENMTGIALLADRSDAGPFSARVAAIARREAGVLRLGPDDLRWYGATPIGDLVARGGVGPSWLFLACAWLVLMLAGANLANLMLARRLRRAHETALQVALGASAWRSRLAPFTDAMVVTALAIVIAVPIGMLLALVFRPYVPPQWLASALPPFPCSRTIAATSVVAICLASAMALGLSTRRSSDMLMRTQLSMNGTAHGGAGMQRARSLLTLAQSALATMLLVLGATALQHYLRADRVPLGFDRADTFVVEVHLDGQRFPAPEDVAGVLEASRDEARLLPGIDLFGWSTDLPVGTRFVMPYTRGDGGTVYVRYALITPGAARALGYRKLSGRWLDDGDRRDSEPVALVNQAYLDQIDGRGLNTKLQPVRPGDPPARIVGVLANTLRDGDATEGEPVVMLPFAQAAGTYAAMRELMPTYAIFRGTGAGDAARDAFTTIMRRMAPSLALGQPRSLDQVASAATAAPRRDAVLFATLAGIVVSLACVGHFSTQAFEVVARRRALAVRSALGATPMRLAMLVMRGALLNAGMGIVLGVIAIVASRPWLAPLLPGTRHAGIDGIVVAALSMVFFTALAVIRPAIRAASVEPWRISRSE
ncbi:duplicated orphan permease [Luteibacter sp. UNCMF331Sha3.1]|uniref:ABC transporter permease n=1 Tax=Luteibacter sp. UNCMF331Sha3.1 TaxID=1502760 RepID=UPI0008C0498E|nr:ABC transporter permease [Luteibacter sp. UNCMF331Sha3.1]SEM51431.1 duplicated orphan permease [Luteibacter sp. UNCMF331Sha3.1]